MIRYKMSNKRLKSLYSFFYTKMPKSFIWELMAKLSGNFYNLRQVVELSGVTEFTLRAWELRYKAFNCKRTATGRRLYSETDLLRARALNKLTNNGHRISRIAQLSFAELQSLMVQAETEPGNEAKSPVTLESQEANVNLVRHGQKSRKLIELAIRFEWDQFERGLQKLFVKEAPLDFVFSTILPLTAEIDRMVMSQKLSIAQEHILTAMIKEKLFMITGPGSKPGRGAAPRRAQQPQPGAKKMRAVFASPEGDWHDTGILIASRIALIAGAKVLFLGAHMPKEELVETCLRYEATHLVLSSTVSKASGAKEEVIDTLHFLDRQLKANTAIWVGGPNTPKIDFRLKRDYRGLGTLGDFASLLDLDWNH
jgi:MerR family transcriptional regulator, light-induced transcriptional regulator